MPRVQNQVPKRNSNAHPPPRQWSSSDGAVKDLRAVVVRSHHVLARVELHCRRVRFTFRPLSKQQHNPTIHVTKTCHERDSEDKRGRRRPLVAPSSHWQPRGPLLHNGQSTAAHHTVRDEIWYPKRMLPINLRERSFHCSSLFRASQIGALRTSQLAQNIISCSIRVSPYELVQAISERLRLTAALVCFPARSP